MHTWTHKYLPKDTSGVENQEEAIRHLRRFISGYKSQKKKAAIIYGPVGCGKTSAVYALAGELGLEIIEVNASDFRNQEQLNSTVGSASRQMSLFSKGKIILVDEIDGLSGSKDRGGITALVKLIEKSAFPIICTASDPFDKKFSTLRKKSEMLQFQPLDHKSISGILDRICSKEGIRCNDEDIRTLARRSGGDARAAINDLQMMTGTSKELRKNDIDELSQREQEENMINAILKILKTTDPKIAIDAFDNVPEDFDKVFLWVDENMPKEYEKPADLARAYGYISKADMMFRRIRRRQHWRFLVYVNAYLSAGVAVSKDEKYGKFVKYGPTKRLLKIWMANRKYQKRKAIAEKIAEYTHNPSRKVIYDTIPYLQQIFRENRETAKGIADELELSDEEIEWMMKRS
ncbi:MAG: replication factor C large subunit [Candidatus Woesearchaeota archaeon]